MTNKLDYDALGKVVEDFRKEIGANKLHVTYGPEATPETLKEALHKVFADLSGYDQFSEELKLRARLNRYEKITRKILDMVSKSTIENTIDEMKNNPELFELKRSIFGLLDLIPEADIVADVEFMKNFEKDSIK